MTQTKRDPFICKHAELLEEKPIIAREMALLRLLEGQLSYKIPRLDIYCPSIYMFSYRLLSGSALTPAAYHKLCKAQKGRLAKDLALFAYELHTTIPVEFAQSIGFTPTAWPLNPAMLKQYLEEVLDNQTRPFFEHFLEQYTNLAIKPHKTVLLHHDLHSDNILVRENSGRLCGVIDFEDAALGDPYAEFRLLYTIDAQLMEETAYYYACIAKQELDIQQVHIWYLATEYSRLVEITQGKKTQHTAPDILKRIINYQRINSCIPTQCSISLAC